MRGSDDDASGALSVVRAVLTPYVTIRMRNHFHIPLFTLAYCLEHGVGRLWFDDDAPPGFDVHFATAEMGFRHYANLIHAQPGDNLSPM